MGIEFIAGRPDLDLCSVSARNSSQIGVTAPVRITSDREVLASFHETCRADYSLRGPIGDLIRVVFTTT